MIATSYLVALRNGFLLVPPSRGSEITFGLLPTAAGMLAGFLYGQFAGLASIADARRSDGGERARAPRTFSGPVRVRSSVAAFMIAATVPAGLTAVLISMLLSLFFPFYLGGGVGPVFAAALPAQSFLIILMATIVPSTIFILGVHHIARAFGRNRGIEYAGIGSLLGGLCVVLLAPLMPITSIVPLLALAIVPSAIVQLMPLNSIFMLLAPGIVFGAIMGALYRRFAGIEPMPLPEIVIATDEAALVDADHPSRHQHGVILTN